MSFCCTFAGGGGGAGGGAGGADVVSREVSKEVSDEIAKHEKRVDAIEHYVFNNTPGGYLDRHTALHSRLFKDWPEPKRDYKLISQNFQCYRNGLEREYKRSQELGDKYFYTQGSGN